MIVTCTAAFAVVAMIGLAWYNKSTDYANLGGGIAGVLGGLATFLGAYSLHQWTDGKNAKAVAEAKNVAA